MSKTVSTTLTEISAVNVSQKNKRSMIRASRFHSCSSRLMMTASGSTSSPSLPCSGSSAGASTVVLVVVPTFSHWTSWPLMSLNAAACRSLLPVAVAAMKPLRVAADSMLPIADVWAAPRAVLWADFLGRNARFVAASPLPRAPPGDFWSLVWCCCCWWRCSARRQYSLICITTHYHQAPKFLCCSGCRPSLNISSSPPLQLLLDRQISWCSVWVLSAVATAVFFSASSLSSFFSVNKIHHKPLHLT